MAGSKPPISNTEPRLGGLRMQTSLYGQTVPVVYGRARIPGNLLWYDNFKAVRQEEQSEASKGGGSRPTRQYYVYSASVAMLLAEGPLVGVRTVYKGKQRFQGEPSTTTPGTGQHTGAVPATSPYTVTVPSASTWSGDAGVVVPTNYLLEAFFGYTVYDQALVPGVDYTATSGAYTFPSTLANQTVRISYTTTTVTPSVDALSQMGLALSPGTPGQPVWQYLTSNFPAEAVPYSGFAYLRGQDYPLTSAAEVENHSFEVVGFLSEYATGDARPWKVLRDMLVNTRYGCGWPSGYLGDWSSYDAYCDAYGLSISPAFMEQRAIREWIADILDATNTDAAWTGSTLKLIPRGDENAGSYTAPVTPAFDLGVEDFLAESGEMPVRMVRSGQQDIPNVVRVEYANRARDYNFETVSAEDESSMVLNGKVEETAQTWHFFAEAQAAKSAAYLRLQRLQSVRRQFAFSLPWRFAELEPGDLVTLTEPFLGLVRVPVRITKISEKDGDSFELEVVDFPIGHATAPIVAPQLGSGFRPDYNRSPGNVATPAFFEPPGGYTSGGLEVWVAVSGQSGTPGQYWGGAEVYASLDGGTSYKQVGRVEQGARYGTLSGALAAGSGATLSVAMAGRAGTLRTVSPNEADAMATLLFIGSSGSGEFISFQNAALTGAGAYSLSGLRRARFGTTDQAATSGTQWVYVDGALGTSGPLADDMVGKTIFFKFCSFNAFGGGLQQLADVTPYSYTVSGRFRSAQAAIVSANWLDNASCYNGVEGWALGSSASPNVSFAHLTVANIGSPAYVLAGTPGGKGSGWFVRELGDRPANGVPDVWVGQPTRVYPVEPSTRVEGSAYLCTHRCTMDLRVAYYRADGTYITERVLWGAGEVNDQALLTDLALYGRRGGFDTVPAGAARAMLFARKYARITSYSATDSYALATRLYMGPALLGQTVLSPWVDGPMQTVSTSDIAAGAATTVVARENQPGRVFSLPTVGFIQYSLGEFVAEADGSVEISVTFDISASGGSVPNVITGGIYTNSGKLPLVVRTLMTAPSGATLTEMRTLTATIAGVQVGERVAPLLQVSRSLSGVQSGNSTDRFYAVSSRLTLIKR